MLGAASARMWRSELIARVRIALEEKWCPPVRSLLEKAVSSDLESASQEIISIETNSMRTSSFCGGREWLVVAGDVCSTDTVTGTTIDETPNGNLWACEHMLEMD
jgi:hypothetical protein